MSPTEERQKWLDRYGIDIWKAKAIAQYQGLLPEFEDAMRAEPPNLALLRGMQRHCDLLTARQKNANQS